MKAKKIKDTSNIKNMPLSFKVQSVSVDRIKAHWEKISNAIAETEKRQQE